MENERVPHQLPPEPPIRYGRSDQLAAVMAGARPVPGSRNPAAVVVHGPPGSGKSALLTRAGRRLAEAFPDGQILLTADAPDELVARVLDALGVPPAEVPSSADERVDRYRSMLADRRVLVVLDGADSADQVRPLMPPGPGSALLVAARGALPGLTGVRRIEVRHSPAGE
jgi:Cdc6-like AAA superfamily ATPase